MRRRLLRGRRQIDADAEATEVIEERIVSGPAVAGPPLTGPESVAPALIEEEVGPRVISEEERVGIGLDGTVIREYDRVETEPVRRRKGVPELGWALLVLLVLVLAGLAVWWFFVRAETRQVPGVTGVPLATAVTRLQNRGFKSAITSQSHPGRPGIVFAQSPGAGRDEEKGSTVQIFVSQAPVSVPVPNAVGLSEATARDRIAAAGFQVTEAKVFSQQPAGTVTAQNPAAGGKAAKGTTIRINVSKGTGVVIVPNVVGQTLGEAETQLAKAGLTGALQFRVQSAQPAGTVVAQNPPGGQARQGSKVELNVSRGAATTPSTTAAATTTTTPSSTTSPAGTTATTP
jgi:beta-lactam-binding protein with PASTA domain